MAPGEFSATSAMHMIVHQLFTRLVFTLQFESSLSMEIISFWLWLEGIGHADFLASIDSLDNYRLHSIASAAKMFIEALRLRSIQSNHRSVDAGGYFRKEAVKGIVFYLNNVCHSVLQDILEVATAKENIYRHANQAQQQYVKGKATMTMSTKDLLSKIKASFTSARSHGEGSSSRSIMIQMPQQPNVPRDERTLFVTFSNGYPFTADELYEFFIANFGDVEVISVQEPVAPKPPLYAHITFYSQDTLFRVLAGHPRVKFVIRGKHLWARKFVPKRKKAHNF
ncbi:hypothetical protein C2845_PM03G25520 [Panicum miliaceum]|uniref:RRM domain-containing protein n=1 Tax=Panicum miliaceum TaxID=4540 RepID=A0A3L6TCX8_PANMI|nr:hypothetical protein C2845_PM03G25520 [Panicum miliaceum]